MLLQPKVSLNYAVSPAYAHNFSIAQRVTYLNLGEETLAVRNIDLSHFSNFRLGVRHSFGLGILYRFREAFEDENTDEIRFTEQFNYVSRPNSLRFGHRLRVEQRLFPSQSLHRFRYRFALDGPLEGKKLDPGELYWIGSLEGLLSAGKGVQPVYALRTSGWLGYLANAAIKIQVGGEYRIVNIGKSNRPFLFLLTSLVINL